MPWESIVRITGMIVFIAFATTVFLVDRTTPRIDH